MCVGERAGNRKSPLASSYALLSRHYEAAWTNSWCHRRCTHANAILIEAAKCAMPHEAGWYVFAVKNGTSQQLIESEERLLNDFRFGTH